MNLFARGVLPPAGKRRQPNTAVVEGFCFLCSLHQALHTARGARRRSRKLVSMMSLFHGFVVLPSSLHSAPDARQIGSRPCSQKKERRPKNWVSRGGLGPFKPEPHLEIFLLALPGGRTALAPPSDVPSVPLLLLVCFLVRDRSVVRIAQLIRKDDERGRTEK